MAEYAYRMPAGEAFDRLSLNGPSIEVDTTDGYASALDEIAAFAADRLAQPW